MYVDHHLPNSGEALVFISTQIADVPGDPRPVGLAQQANPCATWGCDFPDLTMNHAWLLVGPPL